MVSWCLMHSSTASCRAGTFSPRNLSLKKTNQTHSTIYLNRFRHQCQTATNKENMRYYQEELLPFTINTPFFIDATQASLSQHEITGVLQPVSSCSVQFPQLDKVQFADWSRAVGSTVHSLVMHQYWNSICCETQVQLHSSCSIFTGLQHIMKQIVQCTNE